MMRITLVALVALSSVFVCQGLHLKAATFTSEIADIKPRNDLLLNLLPLYGHLKLKYILSRKNYNTAAVSYNFYYYNNSSKQKPFL